MNRALFAAFILWRLDSA